MKKSIFKVNFINFHNNEKTYCFVKAFTANDAKEIIINKIAQGDARLIKIIDVKTVSEKEFKDAMKS